MFPCDMKIISVHEILKLLKKGFCFDYWCGKPNIYWIQPKVSGNNEIIQPLFSEYGVCVFFVDGFGCTLSFEERPTQYANPMGSVEVVFDKDF